MLNKNEIIKELKNEDFTVRKAVYEYVCNLHLYDDAEINEALIEFIKDNYKEINFAGLLHSKVNKEIIECLININLKEEDEDIKQRINNVLVNHYSIIKDLDYNFEEIITDEENLLLYKKIKHFSKKDANQLKELYTNNVFEYYLNDEDTYISQILRMAMGTALIQTEEGYEKLLKFLYRWMKLSEDEYEDYEYFYNVHMPYLIYPLCQYASSDYSSVILGLYFENMDFLAYADECNYYFSTICNDEFVEMYIKTIKGLKKGILEEYHYDISQYLNSEKIDEFLFEELKRNKNKTIKENIIGILASKFNKNIITYALDYIEKGNAEDEYAIKDAIYPLLVLEKREDDLSKNIINEIQNYNIFDDFEQNEMLAEFLNNFQNLMLKNKPHIKEYKKIRKLHDGIMDDMMQYYDEGKFKLEINYDESQTSKNKELIFMDNKFDTRTELGMHAMANILVYKNSCNMNCITEEFIKNKKYRSETKLQLLDSMLNSEAGLFEIIKTDREQGQVYLKNVLNNKEFCVTDIGFSGNLHNDKIYLYTRIITYNGISFGTGFNIPFYKNDEFICKWIEENAKVYDKEQEIKRVMELYNRYQYNDNGIKSIIKNL